MGHGIQGVLYAAEGTGHGLDVFFFCGGDGVTFLTESIKGDFPDSDFFEVPDFPVADSQSHPFEVFLVKECGRYAGDPEFVPVFGIVP